MRRSTLILVAFGIVFFANALPAKSQAEPAPKGGTSAGSGETHDLSTASAEDLLKVYTDLRSLQGSEQGAVTGGLRWHW